MNLLKLEAPVIAAHRGVSSLFPENTMPAFISAVNLGCKMIELDVGVTKDSQFVVIHDETLDRTTSGTGKISDNYYAEIHEIDAGFKLSKGQVSAKVPLLSDVLDYCLNRIFLNIEIKSEVYKKGRDKDSHEYRIAELVERKQMTGQVIFSSFNLRVLERLRSYSDNLHIGILTSGEPRPPVKFAKKINAFSWHPEHVNLSKRHIRYFKKQTGRMVIPYTVNKSKRASKLLKAGVDGFFTDYPQKFIKTG